MADSIPLFGAILDPVRLREVYLQLLAELQPDVCCDVGCHNGQTALLSQRAAQRSAVYAFEANPEIFRLHHEQLVAAGIHHLHLAITDRAGEVSVFAPRTLSRQWTKTGPIETSLVEPETTGKTSLLRRNEDATYHEFKVPGESLDGFFGRQNRDISGSRFALWIDVEGAALRVLLGSKKVLRAAAVVFIEVENFPFWQNQRTAAEVADHLRARGFVAVAQDREYGDDQFNILFVRPEHRALAQSLIQKVSAYPPSDLPVLIPSFNNPTHLRAMIAQLRRVGLPKITVVDNASTFRPMLDYLDQLAGEVSIIRREQNFGPRELFRDPEFSAQLPQFFCLTDPDLEFNPALPSDFLAQLCALTERERIGKAGFALDISEPERMLSQTFRIGNEEHRICDWEAQFWQTPIAPAGEDPAYRAILDTTFAVYNKEFFEVENHLPAIRVAGRYTARHLPWYRDYQLPPDEAAHYRATSKHSFYRGQPPPA